MPKRTCGKCSYVDEFSIDSFGGVQNKRTCSVCKFSYLARVKGKKKKKLKKILDCKPDKKITGDIPVILKPGFYFSDQWLAVRYEVIKKYDRRCMVCFRTRVELHVDHIKPRSKFPELALDLSNLQILCRDCNLGKSNRDEIDWRPSEKS